MRCLSALILALGILPLASWIPGGLTDPAYGHRWVEWGYGTVICLGAGSVSAILFAGTSGVAASVTAWVMRRIAWVRSVLQRWPGASDGVIALVCGVVYLAMARFVLDAKPLLIDELVQTLQARMYAAGRLWIPTDGSPEFFSVLHMVDIGDRVYSQFPPGWPAMLALGSLIGAEWMVGPACGAIAVFLFARLLRHIYPDGASLTVAGGALLFGLGPFAAIQFASRMSHGPVVMWILLGTVALANALHRDRQARGLSSVWAVLAGLAAGCAFAVRPLDAVAFALPGATWLFWRARADSRARSAAVFMGAGLAVPVALVMWVNVQTTGSPTVFGYEVLWGSSHGLGFHAAPWGDAHTPQRGIELISLYLTRLNAYLFEAPFPGLLLVACGLVVAAPLTVLERLLLSATLVHGLLYFAYWHDGFYLGPRFVVPWIPILVLACVRLARWFLRNDVHRRVRAGAGGALFAAVVLAVMTGIPARMAQYRSGLVSMRADYSEEASRAGVQQALVFVRESWGAQLVARMWALGVSRPAAASLYSGVDACELEHAIGAAEGARLRGPAAENLLEPLLRNSHLVQASTISPDTTERMRPGVAYDSLCVSRVIDDREGYALFPPFLLDQESGNLYVRSIPGRDTMIIRRYPNRRAYLARRDGVDGTASLRWTPIESEGNHTRQ